MGSTWTLAVWKLLSPSFGELMGRVEGCLLKPLASFGVPFVPGDLDGNTAGLCRALWGT